MSEPITDKDGFVLHYCTVCKKNKMAALFSPSELKLTVSKCIKCLSDARKRNPSARQAKSPPSLEIWGSRKGSTIIRHGKVEPLFKESKK